MPAEPEPSEPGERERTQPTQPSGNAAVTDALRGSRNQTRLRIFDTMLGWFTPGRLVDLGAGHGAFSIRAADAGWDVTAVDARTTRFPDDARIQWVHQDVRDTSFQGYDLIVNLGLFYHLTLDDQLRLLDRAAGTPMILDTHVATDGPNRYNLSEPVRQRGYDGRYSEPKANLKNPSGAGRSAWGNSSSFWPTPDALRQMLDDRGWEVFTLTPFYLSTRTFFLCQPRCSGVDPMRPAGEGTRALEVLADERGRTVEAPHLPEPPATVGLLLPRFDDGRLGRPPGVVENNRRARRETIGQQWICRVAHLASDPADRPVDEQQIDRRQVGQHRDVEPRLVVPARDGRVDQRCVQHLGSIPKPVLGELCPRALGVLGAGLQRHDSAFAAPFGQRGGEPDRRTTRAQLQDRANRRVRQAVEDPDQRRRRHRPVAELRHGAVMVDQPVVHPSKLVGDARRALHPDEHVVEVFADRAQLARRLLLQPPLLGKLLQHWRLSLVDVERAQSTTQARPQSQEMASAAMAASIPKTAKPTAATADAAARTISTRLMDPSLAAGGVPIPQIEAAYARFT